MDSAFLALARETLGPNWLHAVIDHAKARADRGRQPSLVFGRGNPCDLLGPALSLAWLNKGIVRNPNGSRRDLADYRQAKSARFPSPDGSIPCEGQIRIGGVSGGSDYAVIQFAVDRPTNLKRPPEDKSGRDPTFDADPMVRAMYENWRTLLGEEAGPRSYRDTSHFGTWHYFGFCLSTRMTVTNPLSYNHVSVVDVRFKRDSPPAGAKMPDHLRVGLQIEVNAMGNDLPILRLSALQTAVERLVQCGLIKADQR